MEHGLSIEIESQEKKGLIIGVSLGGTILGVILWVVGAAMAVADAAAAAS